MEKKMGIYNTKKGVSSKQKTLLQFIARQRDLHD